MKSQKKKILNYTVVFEPDEISGGYNIVVPALPGCFTQGDTLEEAKENAIDAIQCHLGGLLKDGEKIPESKEDFISKLSINFSQIKTPTENKFIYA